MTAGRELHVVCEACDRVIEDGAGYLHLDVEAALAAAELIAAFDATDGEDWPDPDTWPTEEPWHAHHAACDPRRGTSDRRVSTRLLGSFEWLTRWYVEDHSTTWWRGSDGDEIITAAVDGRRPFAPAAPIERDRWPAGHDGVVAVMPDHLTAGHLSAGALLAYSLLASFTDGDGIVVRPLDDLAADNGRDRPLLAAGVDELRWAGEVDETADGRLRVVWIGANRDLLVADGLVPAVGGGWMLAGAS